MSGMASHRSATPTERPEPDYQPKTKTKFGPCRCPNCETFFTGLAWGTACPYCGCVRMHEGGWFPW